MMDDIAIVGLSFKLPQDAKDPDSLWEILQSRKNLMTEWPQGRTNVDSFYETTSTASSRVSKIGPLAHNVIDV